MRESLELVPFTVAEVVGLVDGQDVRPRQWHPQFPAADTLDAARMLLLAYEAVGVAMVEPTWWMYAIVVDGVVVGDAGFHGPPATSGRVEVEIGYEVVPDRRGRGFATRACALLLEHAWRHGADAVRADADPENLASRAVLRACGFALSERGDFTVIRERAPAWKA